MPSHTVRHKWFCVACGADSREAIIRGGACPQKLPRPMTTSQVQQWLERRNRDEEKILTIKSCATCAEAFLCYIVDKYRRKCYKEECHAIQR